jgi:outer membrane biogenesis lipoprotein LolB
MDMKKFIAASLSAFAFLALAACTEGDPGMAPDQPMEQTEPAPLD